MFYILPPPDNIARALEKFRKDISYNQFKISTHANERMTQRGISQAQVMEVVRQGSLSKGKVIQDYIGGKFIYKDLCVVVYAEFGNYNALPNIITVFRDGDEDEYVVGDLPSIEKVKDLEIKLKNLSQKAGESVDALSDDELEALLIKRREAKATAEKLEQERITGELLIKRESLITNIAQLQGELSEINEQLGIVNSPVKLVTQPATVGPVEPVRFSSGKINVKATKEKQAFADQLAYMQSTGNFPSAAQS